MNKDKLFNKNLQNVSGGIKHERLKVFSVVTEDEQGKVVEVKSVSDIKPNNHYWLNPHTGRCGDWMVIGYGRDGDAERWIRALNGENSLSIQDIAAISEAYSDLV